MGEKNAWRSTPVSQVTCDQRNLEQKHEISLLTEKAPEFGEVGARIPELFTELGTPNLVIISYCMVL